MNKVATRSLDFDRGEHYTLQKSSQVSDMAQKTRVGTDLQTQVREFLERQGYEVTHDVRLKGKSGIQHTFDMLAKREIGLTNHTIAIGISSNDDAETETGIIFDLANKAYDCGISDRVLFTVPGLSQETIQLARKQRIKVIGIDRIGQSTDSKPVPSVKPGEQGKFETKEDLVKSLVELGYNVEEKAKVKGRSGIEYTFDILARTDNGQMEHSMVIDFLKGDKEVNLDQVMLFDTKAYEVGVDERAIVVSPDLSSEAEQFVQHQRVKVIRLGQGESAGTAAGETLAKPAKALEKAPDKTQGKLLRQAPQPEAVQLIPEVMARRYNAIPLTITGRTLEVAMADPTDIFALEAFSAQSRMRIKARAAAAKDIRDAIDFNYKAYGEIEEQISRISIPVEATDEKLAMSVVTDTPLVQALNLVIEEGVKARASDIHIEPQEDRVRIRYRIDGTLQDMMSVPINAHRALISRIKILGGMNIADHFRPQDGQFTTQAKGREVDLRVATAPTVHGERATLRILDKSMASLGLAQLGMAPDSLARFESMLKIPYGMILVSGPTGAGKTTTLYAVINSLDTQQNNVITIEDPAEYRFADINQIQVNNQAGITFASGLRSILRLDPDVILVGEIRDAETANIAVQAALTGHLLLSSIHANDTGGVLSRLLDLRIESFLVASAVIGVVAQRMVRRVCPDCARMMDAPVAEQMAYEQEMGEKQTQFSYGTGCKSCSFTGYLGRTGIFEIMLMSEELGIMVINRASSSAIRNHALESGMTSIMVDGMRKAKEGITTPSEVLRNAYTAA